MSQNAMSLLAMVRHSVTSPIHITPKNTSARGSRLLLATMGATNRAVTPVQAVAKPASVAV